jgi:hypothetical protein
MTDTSAPAGEQATPAAEPAQTESEVSMDQVEQLLRADQEAESTGYEEPAPEPKQEPAKTEEPAQQADDEPRGDLRVPLREERERRRLAEQRAADLAQQQKQLSGFLEQISRQINPQPGAVQAQVPEFEVDPAGHLKHQVETLNQTLASLRAQEEERRQRESANEAIARAQSLVARQEASFVEKNPDYYDALDYVRGKLRARFEILGVPKEELDAAVAQDLKVFGIRSLQGNANPAEKIYKLARIEGYTGTREAQETKLATIAKGTQASRGARSSAPASNEPLTIEQAASLSYKELGRMSEDEWRKLAGG